MLTNLIRFVEKFWIQSKKANPIRNTTLPVSDLVAYTFHAVVGETTRVGTIEIYSNDLNDPIQILEDDGQGNIIELVSGVLSTATGATNTVDYDNNTVTITYDPLYLAKISNPFLFDFKIVLDDISQERHAQMKDFIAEVLQDYKTAELEDGLKLYDPENIPSNLFDKFASQHNWIMDRTYSEAEEYLRRQLRFLYNLYKSKRKLDGINFAVSVIQKRVTLYNMLAIKGIDDDATADNYNDFSKYVRFNTDALLALTDTNASDIQDIYDVLYDENGIFYPTKHFLLDQSLDRVNEDGSLLRTIDIATLRFYTLAIKAHTQYPHFATTLGVNADTALTEQDGSQFEFLLGAEDALFSINSSETIYAGPNGVFSIGLTGTGAWLVFPMIMNNRYKMNSGIVFNMDISDIGGYISEFQLGTDSYDTLTDSLTSLKSPFFSSNNIEFLYEGENVYFICTVAQSEANDTEIKEMGLFSAGGDLTFYVKNPTIVKKNSHTLVFKIKIDSVV